MDSQGETVSADPCLEEHLTRSIHELRHGNRAQLPIDQVVHSLSKLYETEAIQATCRRISCNLPPAITDTQTLVKELQALIGPSASTAAPSAHDSASDLNILSERVGLLWQLNDLSAASSDYSRLLDTALSSRTKHTVAMWQINNLLAQLALDSGDIACSREMTMQAMFCAHGLGDAEKVERSEFSLACTLSRAGEGAKLKDNFVVLRSAVLGEQSLLPISQQHLVLIYSVRDFCRRKMQASARWILETTEEYRSQMLPSELAKLYTEQARLFELSDQENKAKEVFLKIEALNKKLQQVTTPVDEMLALFRKKDLTLTACTTEKRQLLDLFLEQYKEVSATLQ